MNRTGDLLSACYEALLGRGPDPMAEVHWAATDGGAASLQGLLLRIIHSPEFAKRYRSDVFRRDVSDWTSFFSDHSQFGEIPILIREMVNRRARHRIVVDVGANGRPRSNSFDLMSSFAWKGLLIEANPGRIPVIEADFAGLDYALVNCAVSDYVGEAVLYLGANDDISSLAEDATKSWGPVTGGVTVSVRPLSKILVEHGIPEDFDLLSVDAENEDVRILNAVLADGYRPEWIIIEASGGATDVTLDALGFSDILSERYRVVGRTIANLILAKA